MLAYVIRRILATIPVMGVVALFVFSLLYLSPGDPASIIAGDQATTEVVERIRQQLGLNEPFLTQFGRWLWKILHGDLGFSIFSNQPVSLMIFQRIEPTIALTVCAMLVSVCFAVPLGVVAAWKAGSWIDRAVMAFAVAGFSFPTFVIGYVLILTFALWLEHSARAGLCQPERRLLALPAEHHHALVHPRHRADRADRAHDARRHA